MKIDCNKIKVMPKHIGGFNFCVYGAPKGEVADWINHWGLKTEVSHPFVNIFVGDNDINQMFNEAQVFDYVDGFSPNLNKRLHLGHFSNLIFAKAFQSMQIGHKYICILGDTLEGKVEKEDALGDYLAYSCRFEYPVDKVYYASEQKMQDESILFDGEGKYEGTKVFHLKDEKEVGVKSTGATTYFYQDVALAQLLNGSTLYVTGFEQNPHFAKLKQLFPHIEHIGLGLVTIDGVKMSSSEGNVVMMDDVVNALLEKFNGDYHLAWNVISGIILKYAPPTVKNITMKSIDSVETSMGLYFSYTLAKLKSAGLMPNEISEFNSNALKFKLIKAKVNLSPNILFEELVEHTKKISNIYTKVRIKDNPDGAKVFQPMLDDLLYGMKVLGMFDVDKV